MCVCLYSIIYVGEPLVEFHTRPVSDRPSNAYLNFSLPPGGDRDRSSDLSRDLCASASAAETSDDEASGGLLKEITTEGARPKMAIPTKISCDADSEGYMIPSFRTDRDGLACSDCYDTVKQDDDAYLQPSDGLNIYEDI